MADAEEVKEGAPREEPTLGTDGARRARAQRAAHVRTPTLTLRNAHRRAAQAAS
jgi:hypothetical protein